MRRSAVRAGKFAAMKVVVVGLRNPAAPAHQLPAGPRHPDPDLRACWPCRSTCWRAMPGARRSATAPSSASRPMSSSTRARTRPAAAAAPCCSACWPQLHWPLLRPARGTHLRRLLPAADAGARPRHLGRLPALDARDGRRERPARPPARRPLLADIRRSIASCWPGAVAHLWRCVASSARRSA